MQDADKNVGMLFETSWEVCNKIGGIYTVLSSRAKVMHEAFGDKLVFIGPDVWTEEHPSPYFLERKSLLRNAATKLQLPYDIKIRVGRWKFTDDDTKPLAVLVDFNGVYKHLDEIYGLMWEKYGVDSLHSYGDYSEGCAFAVASAIVMKALASHLKVEEADTLAHFNEWTTAMGLLYLQQTAPEIATLFTTHATSIGRSICGNGKPLYDYFEGYHGDQMASELNMESKHSLEKAAAHAADCFTTVSEVTARECRQLLDIDPQVVTPNGFNPKHLARIPDQKARTLALGKALTGHDFNDDTFLIATSGRNEYRNKGIDLYIDALEILEGKLTEMDRDVIAFILVPAWVNRPEEQLIANIANGKHEPVHPDFMTHRLFNEDVDAITNRLRRRGDNGKDRKVTIFYYPCYLDSDAKGNNRFLDEYYHALTAFDLTVFPSYYEPWGYTPLESIAYGVPTVTSDKSGFGQWVLDNFPNSLEKTGVKVVERNDSNYDAAAHSIADQMAEAVRADKKTATKESKAAIATAKAADWKLFIERYYEAYDVARKRRTQRVENSKK